MDVSARSKRARVCSGCVVLCACQTSFPSSPVCDSRPLAPAFSLSPSVSASGSLTQSRLCPGGRSRSLQLQRRSRRCCGSSSRRRRYCCCSIGGLQCKDATDLMERFNLSGLQRSLMRQAGQCFQRNAWGLCLMTATGYKSFCIYSDFSE